MQFFSPPPFQLFSRILLRERVCGKSAQNPRKARGPRSSAPFSAGGQGSARGISIQPSGKSTFPPLWAGWRNPEQRQTAERTRDGPAQGCAPRGTPAPPRKHPKTGVIWGGLNQFHSLFPGSDPWEERDLVRGKVLPLGRGWRYAEGSGVCAGGVQCRVCVCLRVPAGSSRAAGLQTGAPGTGLF